MRFGPTRRTASIAEPFSGQGVSLYVTIGSSVQYRTLSLVSAGLRGAERDIGAVVSNPKTTRVASASSPASTIAMAVDAAWYSQTIAVDARQYKDDVENETSDPRIITLDGSGNSVAEILGTATLLGSEQRDGGIVRIRFVWTPSEDGLQPDTFTAIRTAGPSSPANAAVSASTGRQLIEIDTPVLSDASAYTYKIQAASGATTLDILTGISITADATGPTAPSVTAVEW